MLLQWPSTSRTFKRLSESSNPLYWVMLRVITEYGLVTNYWSNYWTKYWYPFQTWTVYKGFWTPCKLSSGTVRGSVLYHGQWAVLEKSICKKKPVIWNVYGSPNIPVAIMLRKLSTSKRVMNLIEPLHGNRIENSVWCEIGLGETPPLRESKRIVCLCCNKNYK